jgi:hypothetical protein
MGMGRYRKIAAWVEPSAFSLPARAKRALWWLMVADRWRSLRGLTQFDLKT